MIPIHKLSDKRIKEIRVLKLGMRSYYNIYEPHRHDYFELFFFNEGGGIHEIDFNSFPIESCTVHILSAGRVHQLTRALNSNGYVIIFHPSIFESNNTISQFLFDLDCYDVQEHPPVYSFSLEEQQDIILALKSIWKNHEENNEISSQFILNKLSLICLHCINNSNYKNYEVAKDQEIYIAFRQLLKHNFDQIKKVKIYAEKLGVTARKLNAIIKSKTGISASKIIHRQIILEAKRLLNSAKSSKEVAYKLQFDDPAHFSKFFKTQTGKSPSEFLKGSELLNEG